MSSKYPAGLDTNAELPVVSDNITETGAESINGLIKAIIAIEKAIGIDPQGSQATLTDRLANSLNADGTIKAAALAAAGLVSLPIVNSQVGVTAGIVEDKLDLDVATQVLQDQVVSNDIDISELQDQLANEINKLQNHFLGLADRHSSDQIDHVLADGYIAGVGSTVKSALDFLNGTILAHRSATVGVEHNASVIKYIPQLTSAGEQPIITATNVQDAIDQFDDQFAEERRLHNDYAHSDGVSSDGYTYLSGQAGVNDASASITVYKTAGSSEILKAGLLNAAVIKSSGFSVNDITISSSSVVVTTKSGIETRSVTISNIHLGGANEGVTPSGAGFLSLEGVVKSFNVQFALSRFPATAFASDDGELVLQHNIARDDCTIKITNPAINAAVTELGFFNVVGKEVYRQEVYRLVVNGTPFIELKTIADGYVTNPVSSAIVDIGVSDPSIRENQLFHIFNHSGLSGDSGTYRVTSIAGTTVTLDQNISAGSFDYIIYGDSFDTSFVGSPKTVDLYIDKARDFKASVRAEVTSSQMSGLISVIEVSQNVPVSTGTLSLTKVGSTYELSLVVGGDTGKITTFEEGFIGDAKVYFADGAEYIVVQVVNQSPPSPRTDTISFYKTESTDDNLILGTSHVRSGATIVEFPVDKRNVGLVGNSSIGTEFRRGVIERDLGNLRASGIQRGFDIYSNTSSSVVINGGEAYVNGRYITKKRRTINITNVATSAGTWNLILAKDGNFLVKNELLSGYSLSESIRKDNFIILAQFTIDATPNIVSVLDARLLINDIDMKLDLTVDSRNLGVGTFNSLASAVLYSRAEPNNAKPHITILSDTTEVPNYTVDSSTSIYAKNDLTFQGDLTLSSGSLLSVDGKLSVTGQVFMEANSTLICNGLSAFSDAIDMSDNCTLNIEDSSLVQYISISGDNITISGSKNLPRITFSGIADGIQTVGIRKNLKVVDLTLSMTISTNSILRINGDFTKILLENCVLKQGTSLLIAQLSTSRSGISSTIGVSVSDVIIRECEFTNLGAGLYTDNSTWTELVIRNSNINNIGYGVYLIGSTNSIIKDCTFDNTHNGGITLGGTSSITKIEGNLFLKTSAVPSTLPAVNGLGTTNDIQIVSNSFYGWSSSNVIRLVAGNYMYASKNILDSCITTDYAVFLVGSSGELSNSVITQHTGSFAQSGGIDVFNNYINGDGSSLTSFYITGSRLMRCDSNTIISTNSASTVGVINTSFRNNTIYAGSMSYSVFQAGLESAFTNNKIVLIDGSVQNSISIENTSLSKDLLVSGNHITGSGTLTSVLLKSGWVTFSENFVSGLGTRVLQVGEDQPSELYLYMVSSNHISGNSGTGIYVSESNVSVLGNTISGVITGDDVLIKSGQANIFVKDNFSNSSGVGSGSFRHEDGAPTNALIIGNKNAIDKKVYSSLNSLVLSGTWTKTVSEYTLVQLDSATTNDTLVVPLNDLPVGAKLVSVTLLANTFSGAGDLEISILKRDSSLGIGVSAISAIASSLAASYQSIVSTPSSTEYITNNNEYMLYVKSKNVGNSLGQVIVSIKN